MSPIAICVLAAIVLSGGLAVYLKRRQAASVAANRDQVPPEFSGAVTLGEHQRAADYTLAKTRLSTAETVFDAAFAILLLTALLAPIHAFAAQLVPPGLSRSVAIVVLAVAVGEVASLPFSIANTFWLEARFGFNRTTIAMFLRDRVKTTVLQLGFGVPVLFGLFWLLRALPDYWWILGFAASIVIMIGLTVIYPRFIAPLFNRFTPLPDGPMKSRIETLLAACGFESSGLFVMDASKRSTHGNAYFSGFGKAKRIVFFDTLLDRHGPDEILAVLAHELGHFKLGHILQRIAEAAVFSFLGFAALHWAFTDSRLASGFGVPNDPGVVLIIVLTAMGPVLHLLSPLTSWLSRRAEFEADRFAKTIVGAEPMIGALTKLSRDNLATLTPDHLYARFYYSHPPVPLRIAELLRG